MRRPTCTRATYNARVRRFLIVAAVIFGLPLAAVVLAINYGAGWLLAFLVFELVFAKTQLTTLRGWGALHYNRKGVRHLEAGDAAAAAVAFARALRFSNGSLAYVNNLALALVYTGELDRSATIASRLRASSVRCSLGRITA